MNEMEDTVFGNRTDTIKSMVVLMGADVFDAPFISTVIQDQSELEKLFKIVSNPDHPWMVEHYDRQNFTSSSREKRKAELLKVIRSKMWSRMSSIDRLTYRLKSFLRWFFLFLGAVLAASIAFLIIIGDLT